MSSSFVARMLMDKLDIYHEDVFMKLFMFSLGGDARLWYKSLSPSSISSLKEFHTTFHKHCKRIYSAELLFEDCCNKEFIEQEKILEQEDFLQEDQANFHEEEEKMSEIFQEDEEMDDLDSCESQLLIEDHMPSSSENHGFDHDHLVYFDLFEGNYYPRALSIF
jgi:hypothetical protein